MKTLIVDIETSPNVAHVWRLFNENVSLDQLQEPSFTLCWAAKWRGSKKTQWASYQNPDFLDEIWVLLDEADAVVHYNGDKFDIPVLNREFVLADIPPPSPYISIDLYKTVKRRFRFASSKLRHVAEQLKLTQKVEHEGHALWVGVMEGNDKAWRTMKKYNIGDVLVAEELYDRIHPWINNLPNQNLFVEGGGVVCPACGKDKLQRRGFKYTRTGKYQRYFCTKCARWSSGTRRLEGTEIQTIS